MLPPSCTFRVFATVNACVLSCAVTPPPPPFLAATGRVQTKVQSHRGCTVEHAQTCNLQDSHVWHNTLAQPFTQLTHSLIMHLKKLLCRAGVVGTNGSGDSGDRV